MPDAEQRLWRTVMRRKYQITRNRVQLHNRLEALLEEAHIKLSSLVSDLLGISARRMLQPWQTAKPILPPSRRSRPMRTTAWPNAKRRTTIFRQYASTKPSARTTSARTTPCMPISRSGGAEVQNSVPPFDDKLTMPHRHLAVAIFQPPRKYLRSGSAFDAVQRAIALTEGATALGTPTIIVRPFDAIAERSAQAADLKLVA